MYPYTGMRPSNRWGNGTADKFVNLFSYLGSTCFYFEIVYIVGLF